MFVKLQLQSIESLRVKTAKAIAEIVEYPTSEMNTFYDKIFEQMESQNHRSDIDLVNHVFLWTLYSLEPCRLSDIWIARTVDWKNRKMDPSERPKDESDLLLVCGNLVVIESEKSKIISFVHKSVRDYLKQRGRALQKKSMLANPILFTEEEGHAIMALICVTYLHVRGEEILASFIALEEKVKESVDTEGISRYETF